ncbi:MAG: hypothetical protein RLZ33_2900 [Bacteroidota bacterium]|jgi:hypothetical protein
MIGFLKNISFYLVISYIICLGAYFVNSSSLFTYLRGNIIGLLLTLLAINTATLGLIASKMQDLLKDFPTFSFKDSIQQMKLSLLEQIILIVSSVLIIIVHGSKMIDFPHKEFTLDVLLGTVVVYSIAILWDTGKAVFVVIEEIQSLNKRQ